MKHILMILVMTLSMAAPALARLGETKAQCDTRYGEPLYAGTDAAVYMDGSIRLVVTFDKDKVVAIAYRKLISDGLDRASIKKYMAANAFGLKWKRLQREGDYMAWVQAWQRSDGKAVALYHVPDRNSPLLFTLQICTKTYLAKK